MHCAHECKFYPCFDGEKKINIHVYIYNQKISFYRDIVFSNILKDLKSGKIFSQRKLMLKFSNLWCWLFQKHYEKHLRYQIKLFSGRNLTELHLFDSFTCTTLNFKIFFIPYQSVYLAVRFVLQIDPCT